MTSFFQLLVFLVFGLFSISFASPKDYPTFPVEDFTAYWNVPGEGCKKHGVDFEKETAIFGITSNKGGSFFGDKISLLYEPGKFPMMLKNKTTDELVEQNGGIPQLGDINKHLDALEESINKVVPSDFDGLGIIDFETYRPIFRQNWHDQTLYTNMSKNYTEQEKNISSNDKTFNKTVAEKFEEAAKKFMQQTLLKAKEMRPDAYWGFYGFPYCYNFRSNIGSDCPDLVKEENNRLNWLWEESTAFYPSVYIPSTFSISNYTELIEKRLDEALRLGNVNQNFTVTYPYLWFMYNDKDDFLSEEHMVTALETIKSKKMGGVIIWGSSGNVSSKEKCEKLRDYLKKTLGPAVQKLVTPKKGSS